jgi:hypothetical protein
MREQRADGYSESGSARRLSRGTVVTTVKVDATYPAGPGGAPSGRRTGEKVRCAAIPGNLLADARAIWCNARVNSRHLFPPASHVRGGLNGSFTEDGNMSRVTTPPTARPAPHGNTPTTPPPTPSPTVSREKIAMRAYEKWVKSGCPHGHHEQHWLEAEQELKAESNRQAKR